MKYLTRSLLAGVAAIALTAPASAVTYFFSYAGTDTASWQLPASPVPDVVFSDAFRINAVNMIVNGNPVTALQEYYLGGNGGGVCAGFACGILDLYGPQLFSGTLAAPTFLLGSFDMTNAFGTPAGTLRISVGDEPPVIPEPATWAMMIAGFGLVGASIRRRRTATA